MWTLRRGNRVKQRPETTIESVQQIKTVICIRHSATEIETLTPRLKHKQTAKYSIMIMSIHI